MLINGYKWLRMVLVKMTTFGVKDIKNERKREVGRGKTDFASHNNYYGK